jgi:hypothetical protein
LVPNFEEWTMRGTRSGNEPAVTVQAGGIFAVNREAHEALSASLDDGGPAEAVVLLFDRDERVMGLRAVSPDVAHSYRLRPQSNSPSYLVSGRAFARNYQIPTDRARRYPAVMQDGVLTIDLKADPVVPRKPRAKAGR